MAPFSLLSDPSTLPKGGWHRPRCGGRLAPRGASAAQMVRPIRAHSPDQRAHLHTTTIVARLISCSPPCPPKSFSWNPKSFSGDTLTLIHPPPKSFSWSPKSFSGVII